MFKSVMSVLSSTVVGAAKNTINSYKPSSLLKEGGAFERIAQQGIANMSYRSPVLADLAQTMLHNVQIEMAKKQKINEYVKSYSSKDFRETVSKKMGADVSSKKIDTEMSRILEKINKSIDANGKQETEKSSLFQEYSKYFEKFKESSKTPKQDSNNPVGNGSDCNDNAEILDHISSNTQRTYNAIEELALQRAVGGGSGVSGGNQGGSASFIDPVTGMPSMRAAVGSIGGSFLAKIFDDETVSKFAKKTKKMFGLDGVDEELQPAKKPFTTGTIIPEYVPKATTETVIPEIVPKATTETVIPEIVPKATKVARPKPGIPDKTFTDIMGSINLDLNTDHKNESVFMPPKKVSVGNTSESAKESITTISTENTSESAREITTDKNHHGEKALKVAEDSLLELKKLNACKEKESASPTSTKKSGLVDKALQKGKDKIIEKVAPKGKEIVRKGVGKAIEIGKKAASYASKAAGVAEGVSAAANVAKGVGAVAEGGSLLGTIASGIGTVASGVAAPAIAAAAPWVLGAAAVGAAGYGAYKMLGSDGKPKNEPIATNEMSKSLEKYGDVMEPYANKVTPEILPAKRVLGSEVSKLSEAKEKQDAQVTPTPVVITNNNSSQQSAPAPAQSPTIIAGTNVRNNESTFERVQMQDFWHRTA